jgi:1-aminocyclopropane-1-carboxylate deaminase/D-cysteine desulfhydrase-like pyridoxal-dependent ACC family enzyme
MLGRADLLERLSALPRVSIALEEAPRLREALGPEAPRIFIKRDDATGLAFGGNKVRHLEFRFGDIRKKGADTIIVTNVAQSNHARLHTALAAKFGLTTYIIKIPSPKDAPINGNLLLDHIMGAQIVEAPSAEPEAVSQALQELIAKLESEGRVVYSAPTDSFSKIAGTCGYIAATVELDEQLEERGVQADHIFLAHGTSSAGLALGGKALGRSYRVHPVSVGPDHAETERYVLTSAAGVAELLELPVQLEPGDIDVHAEYVGERYGVPTPGGMEALRLAGRTEALIVDPVYTAKALSGLIDQIRQGHIGRDKTVVFVHTGGLPITFAYAEEILASL